MVEQFSQTANENAKRQFKRKELRRQSILAAAAEEFASSGFERATLGGIGERVGLSKASLYYYVDGKEELLIELLDRATRLIEDKALDRTPEEGGPRERLRAFISAHMEIAAGTLEGRLLAENLGTILTEEAAAKVGRRHELTVTAILVDGVEEGLFPELPMRAATKLIFGALNSVPRWFDPEGPMDLDELAMMTTNLLLHGLEQQGIQESGTRQDDTSARKGTSNA